MTQNERIIRHLADYGKTTQLDAMQEYGIMRLASRICDLRKAGYRISKRMRTGKNRYGESTSFAEYSMEGKNES